MTPRATSSYLGSLDGLRFVAFLAVFLHHMPRPAATFAFAHRGWVGIELFFAISSFLLFSLLIAEQQKESRINVRNFYVRRVLRIYPLLVVYYAVMFVAGHGYDSGRAWERLVTTFGSVDNVATWWWNYNFTVPAVGHLWTLSFEFQVYLLLPLAFAAWRRWGDRGFLGFLVAFEIVAFACRWWAIHSGVQYPAFHVIPYLRPESILLGIALAVAKPTWHPAWSAAAALGGLAAFVALPHDDWIFIYPAAGVMVAAMVDAAVRFEPLRAPLSWRPARYLGTISFGLYVFHIAAIWTAVHLLQRPQLHALWNAPGLIAVSLALTIAISALSYEVLERPFLRLKLRFTSVDARGESTGHDAGLSAAAPPPLDPPRPVP